MAKMEVSEYHSQAWDFLAKGRQYLADGDLHQASEKGWGAASHMAKAVAENQGWEYDSHAGFSAVINQVRHLTGNDALRSLRSIANELHGNYYKRKKFLDAEIIGQDIESVAKLLEILTPLTEQQLGR